MVLWLSIDNIQIDQGDNWGIVELLVNGGIYLWIFVDTTFNKKKVCSIKDKELDYPEWCDNHFNNSFVHYYAIENIWSKIWNWRKNNQFPDKESYLHKYL